MHGTAGNPKKAKLLQLENQRKLVACISEIKLGCSAYGAVVRKFETKSRLKRSHPPDVRTAH